MQWKNRLHLRLRFRTYLGEKKRRWISALAVLTILSAVGTFLLVPTLYASRVSVAIINRLQQQEEDAGKTVTDILIKSHNLASHFAALYASHEIAEEALNVMGWTDDMTEEQLLQRISVDRTAGTLIINITASHTNPAIAQQLATVYADAMVNQLTAPLEINNVETVRGASDPVAYSHRLPVFTVCVVIAAMLVFLIEYLNFKLNIRISSIKDVESYGYYVIGVVPTTTPIRQAPPAPGDPPAAQKEATA